MKDVFGLTRVKKDDEVKVYRQKIGIAYDNEDGTITVKLNAFPISGRLIIQERENLQELSITDEDGQRISAG